MPIIKVIQEPPATVSGRLLSQLVIGILKVLLPQGSPDYDTMRFSLVSYWLVEIDEDGYPMREIGFASQDTPVLFAPTTRNNGFWTDSDRVFSSNKFESQDDFPFDATWNSLLTAANQVAL